MNEFNPKIKIPIELYTNPDYNQVRRSYLLLLSSLLEKYDEFLILDHIKKLNLIIDIELNCYNYIIIKSKKLGYIISWTSDTFLFLYRTVMSKITKHIDKESEVHDNLQEKDKYYLFNIIIKEIVPLSDIPYLSSYQLCPQKSEKINQQLKTRTQQKITYKTSTFYTCRNCKKKEVKIIEYQGRALDEQSNSSLTCVYCGFHWVI